jgi:DNA-binding NarL/FixJ family response regulator
MEVCILIVDNHAALREALRAVLATQSHISVVSEAEDRH